MSPTFEHASGLSRSEHKVQRRGKDAAAHRVANTFRDPVWPTTSSPVNNVAMATKRLIKELDAYNREPSPALSRLEPSSDDDLLHMQAVLRGPDGTAYEGGRWTLSITIPPTYPNTPPEIRFQTPICHSNVNFKTGEICLDLLKTSWTPAYGIVSTLEAVQQLLSAGGEPDSPLNIDLARLLREEDLVGAEALVRFYTKVFAMARS